MHRRYCRLACSERLKECEHQVAAIRRGLTKIIPESVLRLWTSSELARLVAGDPDIPVDEIKRTATISGGDQNTPVIKYLWQVRPVKLWLHENIPSSLQPFQALEEFSAEERSLFLRFCSGRARLPVRISIQLMHGDPTSLPTGATCGNSIGLPMYTTAEQARDKIRYAIHSAKTIDTDGHGGNERFELD